MLSNRQVKKQILYDALVGALNKVIVCLSHNVESGRVPKEPVTKVYLKADGSFTHRHYHRRNYGILSTSLGRDLPELEEAVNKLMNDADVQRHFTQLGFGNLSNYVASQILHQFIYRLLHRTRKWPPSKSAIDTLFFEFEDYLLGTTLSSEALVPLENFDCESKRLAFERNIIIRALYKREKEDLLSRALSGWSQEDVTEVMRHRFVAVIRFTWQKGTTQPHHGDLIEKLLTALRLFKEGGVGANVAYKRELKWQPGHIVGGTMRHIYTLPVQGTIYTLNSGEARDLLAFWRWLYQRQLGNNVEVAMRWFNHGYQDWMPEDRIVSFVTAFESLFLREGDPKRKSLVRRTPRLLTNSAHRHLMEKDVGDLWDLRSNIVHAQPYSISEPPRLVGIAENYLRYAIRRYVELERCITANTHHDILRWLDDPNVDFNKQTLFPHWQTL